MNRGYIDPDKPSKIEAIRRKQEEYRQQLEQQNFKPPVHQEFRDGRMSDEAYQAYENSSIAFFKKSLLNRIRLNDKNLSSFDKKEAEELAKLDPNFAEALRQAKDEAAGGPKMLQSQNANKSPPQIVQQEFRPHTPPQQMMQTQSPPQIIVQSPPQAQQPVMYYPPPQQNNGEIYALQMQVQQLMHQLNSPNNAMANMQLMNELAEQKRILKELQQREQNNVVEELQRKISKMEEQQQQQKQTVTQEEATKAFEMQARIQQLEQEREQLRQQMQSVVDSRYVAHKQVEELNKSRRLEAEKIIPQKKIVDATTSSGVSLSDLEERNRQRWKMLAMIDKEFGL